MIRNKCRHLAIGKEHELFDEQICFDSFFALDREMPEIRQGDLLAIMSAGAYGFVMASNYNSRPLPAEALVRGDKFALIHKRQTVEELVRGEIDPEWLSKIKD